MLGKPSSATSPKRNYLPAFAVLLVVVFFLLTRRREIDDGDDDTRSVLRVSEGKRSVWRVPELGKEKVLAWNALVAAQLPSFSCSDNSNEEYDVDLSVKTAASLWRLMSTEASKRGQMATVTFDNPCARKGTVDKSIHLRAPATDIDVFMQVFKRHFLKMLYPLVDSKTTNTEIEYILDAGANCGMTTVLLASLFPSAVIVSVEPDPQNFEVLKKNAEHLPNVRLVQAGLWDVTGKIALKGNHGQWGRVFKRVDNNDPSGMQAYSIADVLKKFNIPRFDLVKMDIEGSEAVVLGGQGDLTWLEDTKVFFAEVHDMFADYFGLSQERKDVTEIVERVVSERMQGATRLMDNEHTLYFASGVVPGT